MANLLFLQEKNGTDVLRLAALYVKRM